MYKLKLVNKEVLKNISNDKKYNQTVFTTYQWISFLENNKKGSSIVLEISKGEDIVGYFVGLIFEKFGLKILASPFEGWATCTMGFCVKENVDMVELINLVSNYAFKELKCLYMEIVDPNISKEEIQKSKYEFINQSTYAIDLTRSEEDIFNGFKPGCRQLIRQFERRGATISKVEPSEVFANIYYDQLIDVFAKQNLKPSYDRQKVIDLMDAYKDDSEGILCLKVFNPQGECIATSIYPGHKDTCYFWGGASYRESQNYRPNEYMMWYAIKYWKSKGIKNMDLVGIRDYKLKFNPKIISYPRIIVTKYKFFIQMRNMCKKLILLIRRVRGA